MQNFEITISFVYISKNGLCLGLEEIELIFNTHINLCAREREILSTTRRAFHRQYLEVAQTKCAQKM